MTEPMKTYLTEAMRAAIQDNPNISVEGITRCIKCDGSGETQPDVICKRCEGTGVDKSRSIELTDELLKQLER